MSVSEIVLKYLEEVNADGLCSSSGVPCGCSRNDLIKCQKPADEVGGCVPARRVPCGHEQCNHYHGPCEATIDTEWCYVPWSGKGIQDASLTMILNALAKAAKVINERDVFPICPQGWGWEPEHGCQSCRQMPDMRREQCWLAWLMDPKTEAC